MNLTTYLNYINEQFGVAPKPSVRKPQASRPTSTKRLQPKTPKVSTAPVNPQTKKQQSIPKNTLDQIKNQAAQKNPKAYFNYMLWTTKILKQGEIFRKKCYSDNCEQFEAGTGDRRICKDRCDIETCKKVIQLLKTSISKCSQSQQPDKCKVRYMQLIPLYQDKLNKISKKFIEAEKRKQKSNLQVG